MPILHIDQRYFSNISNQFLHLNLAPNYEEVVSRGTPDFPCCAYVCDIQKFFSNVYPIHWHNEIQLTFAYQYPLVVQVNDEHIMLRPGQGIFLNTRVLHSIRALDNDHIGKRQDIIFDASIIYGNFGSVFYRRYIQPLFLCRKLPYVLFNAHDEWNEIGISLFQQAFQACSIQNYGFEFIVRDALSQLCVMICEQYKERIQSSSAIQTIRENRIHQMLEFIYKNYQKPILLQDISASASISERECLRCFKSVLNTSPVSFLKQHRVMMSIPLLEEKADSITSIGYQCGFNTPSYFIKTFSKLIGQTPKQYQNMVSGINR